MSDNSSATDEPSHGHEPGGNDEKAPRKAKVRFWALIPLAVGLALLTAAAVAIGDSEYETHLKRESSERTVATRGIVEREFEQNAVTMHSLLHGIADNPDYVEAFLAGDREALHALAEPHFNDMRERIQISHFYFHRPDRQVFLRMHKPESRGDTIERRTLVDAQSSGAPTVGFEQGPFAAFAQRAVRPWNVDGQVIGYIELTMDLDAIAARVGDELGIDMFAVVEKRRINRDVWEAGLAKYGRTGKWDEFESVVVMDRTRQRLDAPIADYLNRAPTDGGVALLELSEGPTLAASTIPINDLRGDHMADLVVLTNMSSAATEHENSMLYVLAICGAISLLLFVLFYFFFVRVDRNLDDKRRALEKNNQMLAREIAERKRAELALRKNQADLESAVNERTRELHSSNVSLRQESAERERAEQRREEAQKRLVETNASLRAEIAARSQAESELDLMFTITPDMLALAGFDGHFKRVNPAIMRISGYTEEELLTTPFMEFVDPEQIPSVSADVEKIAQGQEVRGMRLRLRHKDGHYFETEWHNVPLLSRGQFLTVGRDVTESVEAEQRLLLTNQALNSEVAVRRQTQEELDQLFTNSLDLLCLAGFDGTIQRVNPSLCDTFGYSEDELLSASFAALVHPDDMETANERMSRLAEGETIRNVVIRLVTKDGRALHTQWNLVPFVERGTVYASGRDITAINEMEQTLRETAKKLEDAQRIGHVGSWEVDLTTGESRWSEEAFRIYGVEPCPVIRDPDVFFSMVHPDDRERVRSMNGVPPKDGEHRLSEHRIILADGSVRDIVSNMEFTCDENGRPLHISGTCQDVTEQRDAERKQAQLEDQLRVSQKLDAIGSLAGGVAHDFNNLLSVILTYVGFVKEDTGSDDARYEDLTEIERAAESAAALTRQLLAFGRKQIFRPRAVSLNEIVEGIEKMLRRLIGEDIELIRKYSAEPVETMADPGQLEQVLMNLIINARDAMPDGGKVFVETANVEIDEYCAIDAGREGTGAVDPLEPGSYVVLSVTDTGHGMDKDVLSRLFEPFFTTKDVGQGTGLGLPTVYGIVKQSGGAIRVYSEPGLGATFRIYLPSVVSSSSASHRTPTEVVHSGGDETILVVEDEDAVRRSAVRILGKAGYTVLTAADGEEALKLSAEFDGHIHLALTDVVMPNLGGPAFTRQLVEQRPDIRVIYMTGYSGEAVAHRGILEPGVELIGKPFNAVELTHKVRLVLDAPQGQNAVASAAENGSVYLMQTCTFCTRSGWWVVS